MKSGEAKYTKFKEELTKAANADDNYQSIEMNKFESVLARVLNINLSKR